jgi:uncharacterized protein YegL
MKHTEIIFVIDKSGSMSHLVGDTIGGFNGFIESQKALDGKATLTTVLFDNTWRMLHDGVDLHEVKPMTTADYTAYGGTAMLDAIGEVINKVQDRHDDLGAEKPENVLFVITTDGEENSSRKFTKSQIEKMIKHQTNGHGWKFMFLGANMDAVKEAEHIGISKEWATNYSYTAQGTSAVYKTMDCVASSLRGCDLDGLTSLNKGEFVLANAYDAALSSAASITADTDICNSKTSAI